MAKKQVKNEETKKEIEEEVKNEELKKLKK
jgi:hypothetical protein